MTLDVISTKYSNWSFLHCGQQPESGETIFSTAVALLLQARMHIPSCIRKLHELLSYKNPRIHSLVEKQISQERAVDLQQFKFLLCAHKHPESSRSSILQPVRLGVILVISAQSRSQHLHPKWLALHQAFTVQCLCLKPPHMNRQKQEYWIGGFLAFSPMLLQVSWILNGKHKAFMKP